MNKQQIINAIVADLRGRLTANIYDDIVLSVEGERQLIEALGRQYMNHPNDMCVQHWCDVLSYCPKHRYEEQLRAAERDIHGS